jgi:hypothetical protein
VISRPDGSEINSAGQSRGRDSWHAQGLLGLRTVVRVTPSLIATSAHRARGSPRSAPRVACSLGLPIARSAPPACGDGARPRRPGAPPIYPRRKPRHDTGAARTREHILDPVPIVFLELECRGARPSPATRPGPRPRNRGKPCACTSRSARAPPAPTTAPRTPWRHTPSKVGACSVTASSSSTTPESCCPTAGQWPRLPGLGCPVPRHAGRQQGQPDPVRRPDPALP